MIADCVVRGGRADTRRLLDFAALPSGTVALVALIVGFLISLPFQTSVVGGDIAKATGLPINTIAAGVLHYADLAYVIGFIAAALIYWAGTKAGARTETRATAEAA